VSAVSYDSRPPSTKTHVFLRSFAIDDRNPTFGQILNQGRGEKVGSYISSPRHPSPDHDRTQSSAVETQKKPGRQGRQSSRSRCSNI